MPAHRYCCISACLYGHAGRTPRHPTAILKADEDSICGRLKGDDILACDEDPKGWGGPRWDLRRHLGAWPGPTATCSGVRLAQGQTDRQTAFTGVSGDSHGPTTPDIHRGH